MIQFDINHARKLILSPQIRPFEFMGNTCPSPNEVKIGIIHSFRLVPKTSSKLRRTPRLYALLSGPCWKTGARKLSEIQSIIKKSWYKLFLFLTNTIICIVFEEHFTLFWLISLAEKVYPMTSRQIFFI